MTDTRTLLEDTLRSLQEQKYVTIQCYSSWLVRRTHHNLYRMAMRDGLNLYFNVVGTDVIVSKGA